MMKQARYEKYLGRSIALYLMGNPFQYQQTTQREMMAQGSGDNSGKGPHRDPRDIWLLICTAAGVIVCCTIGAFIGARLSGLGGLFLGLVAGALIGGFGGIYLGDYLKKRKSNIRYTGNKRDDTKNTGGPIIK